MRDLLKVIALEWFPLCNDDFSARQLGFCFSGLHQMKSAHHEVRLTLSALTTALMNCFDRFSSIDICRIVGSLRCCDSNQTEIQQRLLTVVLSKLRYNSTLANGEEVLTVPTFSHAIYGLQNVSSENSEGLRLLKRLHRYLKKSTPSEPALFFTPRDVELCLRGIRHFKLSDKVVKKFIQTLTSGIIYCSDDQWSTSDICHVFYLLGKLSPPSDIVEVYELVAALTSKLRTSLQHDRMNCYDLGNCMSCLHFLISDYPQALSLLSVLSGHINHMINWNELPESFRHKNGRAHNRGIYYGNVFRGLKNMDFEEKEVKE